MDNFLPLYADHDALNGFPVPPGHSPEVVHLGKILQGRLANMQNEIAPNCIIIRCDELPAIEGNTADFETLFDFIFSFITTFKPTENRPFLYVQCAEEKEINFNIPKSFKLYAIQFHSNIMLDADWTIIYQQQLMRCDKIAGKYHGTFIINTTSTHCLFTMLIAGKPF